MRAGKVLVGWRYYSYIEYPAFARAAMDIYPQGNKASTIGMTYNGPAPVEVKAAKMVGTPLMPAVYHGASAPIFF